jgi:hypothetical protein
MTQNYLTIKYELEHRDHGLTLEFPTWEWADWDRNRLVWAEQGCLRAASVGPRELGSITTLHDFNAMTPTKDLPPT